jgi:hypothetical protein
MDEGTSIGCYFWMRDRIEEIRAVNDTAFEGE